jgi:hypothetical protein
MWLTGDITLVEYTNRLSVIGTLYCSSLYQVTALDIPTTISEKIG